MGEVLPKSGLWGTQTPPIHDITGFRQTPVKRLAADDLVPHDVLDGFRRAHLHASARNALLYAELEKALEVLAAAGIKVIVLKGAAPGKAFYFPPSRRDFRKH